ncbi:MAG: hypothetical protein R6U66_12865 [Bacteroidales bacterium]
MKSIVFLLTCFFTYTTTAQTVSVRVFEPSTPEIKQVYQVDTPNKLFIHFTDSRRTSNEYAETLADRYLKIIEHAFPKLTISALNEPPVKLTPDEPQVYLHITQTDYHVLRKPAKWIARVNCELQLFVIQNQVVKQYEHSISELITRPTRRGLHGAKQALEVAFAQAAAQLPEYINGCLANQYKYTIIEAQNATPTERKKINKN